MAGSSMTSRSKSAIVDPRSRHCPVWGPAECSAANSPLFVHGSGAGVGHFRSSVTKTVTSTAITERQTGTMNARTGNAESTG